MKRILFVLILLTIVPSCILPVSSERKDEIEKFKDPAMIGTATQSDMISDFGVPDFKIRDLLVYRNVPVTRSLLVIIAPIPGIKGETIKGKRIDLVFKFDDQGLLQSFDVFPVIDRVCQYFCDKKISKLSKCRVSRGLENEKGPACQRERQLCYNEC